MYKKDKMELIAYWADDALEEMNTTDASMTKGELLASIKAWKNNLQIIKTITEEI